MIERFQGEDLASENTIAACAKHFVGYAATEGGKDYNTTLIPERELLIIFFNDSSYVLLNCSKPN